MKINSTTIKLITENQAEAQPVKNIKNKFFFRQDDCLCWTLESQVDHMLLNGITEMVLFLAKRETQSPYFFCKHFGECGDKSEGGCGKICEGYKPRNGKSGVCQHYGYTYEQTNNQFVVKIVDGNLYKNTLLKNTNTKK